MMQKTVKIKEVKIGAGNRLVLIAGPCVIESRENCLRTAKQLKAITARLKVPFIFKSSYDKANRTSLKSYRGPGMVKGLQILKEVKETLGLVVLSDIHCNEEVKPAAKVLDVLQIPALLSRQTDLIRAAAATGKAVNVKKGQFSAPWDMAEVVRKIESTGNKNIIITERGTSFGYNNLVSDFRSLVIMRELGYPIIYDATHSVQLPSGAGEASSGESRFVPYLCRAAVAVGCDGLFLEVHENPKAALCDGPNMLSLKQLEELLKQVVAIDRLGFKAGPKK
jgi:2-dehydro-3-deoxyphosphooctonate aldolase (KDO 8-P synthase)